MSSQVSAHWAAPFNIQHLVVQLNSRFLLRIFGSNILIELHPDYACLPRRFSRHILKKKWCFLFLCTQQDSIYRPRADHNSLTRSCLLGKYLRMHLPAANCINTTDPALISYSGCSCWITNWPGAKRDGGTTAWDKSIIMQPGFYYLCLNFMLFKLFMRSRRLLGVIYYSGMDLATFVASWILCWVYILQET